MSKKKKGRVPWKCQCAITLPDFSELCVLETCKCLMSNGSDARVNNFHYKQQNDIKLTLIIT